MMNECLDVFGLDWTVVVFLKCILFCCMWVKCNRRAVLLTELVSSVSRRTANIVKWSGCGFYCFLLELQFQSAGLVLEA